MALSKLNVQKFAMHAPNLTEVASVINDGLKGLFTKSSATVVDCPDLTQSPFMLAASGISGNPSAADIGGVPYLLPTPKMEKIYDFTQYKEWSGWKSSLLIGAAAGPSHQVGTLTELIPNLSIGEGNIKNETHMSKVTSEVKSYELCKLQTTECCHLANIFASDGIPGKVIEIRASGWKTKDHFIESLQAILKQHYGEKTVGIGGVFVLTKGKAKIHIMPCYPVVPPTTDTMVNEWLKFYDMAAPLTSVGYLVTADPGLSLRLEHFHCFSSHGDGGHFHYDVTPEEAEYIAYFNVIETMYRVDEPKK